MWWIIAIIIIIVIVLLFVGKKKNPSATETVEKEKPEEPAEMPGEDDVENKPMQ